MLNNNFKYKLCRDWNETVNHLISECSKIEQKSKRAGMTEWEGWSKRLKFDHTTKWYMHKQESVQENETHTFLWYLEIQGSLNKFLDFFRMGTFIDSTHMKPLRSNLLRLQCTCCTVPTTSGRPNGSPLV